jgi:hypothetical protein
MELKELEKLVNEQIIENGYNLKDNCDDFWSIKQKIKGIVEDILKKQLPNLEFDVHYGTQWHTTNKENRLYASPKHQNFLGNWDLSVFELQIHKTLCYTNYRNIGQWVVNKVTVKPFGDGKSFEELYNDYIAQIKENERRAEERKKQEEIEKQKAEEERLKNFNNAKKEVLDYIESNKLDPKEFIEITRLYSLYSRNYIKGEYHYIFDELEN